MANAPTVIIEYFILTVVLISRKDLIDLMLREVLDASRKDARRGVEDEGRREEVLFGCSRW